MNTIDNPEQGNLMQRMGSLLKSSDFTDVTFVFNRGKEEERIGAHKIILATASPVFKQMFFSVWKETEIDIIDATPEAFKAMMRYIYTDEVSLQNFSLACELLYLANKYLISHLIEECKRHLRSNVKIGNSCLLLPYATVFELTDVEEQCIKCIKEQTRELFEIIQNAEPTFISTVLKLDHLSVSSELEVFDAVLNWGEEECRKRDMKINGRNIRRCIFRFFQYIRFRSLSYCELVTAIAVCRNTLNMEDCRSLLRSARDLKTDCGEMPEYISRRTDPRIVKANRIICTNSESVAFNSYLSRYSTYTIYSDFSSIPITRRLVVTGIFEMVEGKAIVTGFCFGDDLAPRITTNPWNSVLVEVSDGFRRNECKFNVNKDSAGYPKVTFTNQFHVEKGNKVIIKIAMPSCDAYPAANTSEKNPDCFIIDGPAHFKLYPTVHDRFFNRLFIIKDIHYFH